MTQKSEEIYDNDQEEEEEDTIKITMGPKEGTFGSSNDENLNGLN